MHRSVALGAWPAARFLSYAFWRAWFLVMYSSPLWASFAFPHSVDPGRSMYVVSTVCFVVVAIALAAFHGKVAAIFSARRYLIAFGVLASAGAVLEFAALARWQTPDVWVFGLGAALTGMFTAPIAMKTGQVYASARVGTAVTCTLLCDVGAGLVFFFCIGTWPALFLCIAALLPFLAACMLVLTMPIAGDEADEEDAGAGSGEASAPDLPWRSLVRFVVVAFLIGAVAFLQNSYGNPWFSQESLTSGVTLGVSLLVIVSFLLAIAFGLGRELRFEALYRPIVFVLVAFVAAAYLIDFGNPVAIGGSFLVYCLFSSYVWMFLSYLGHSRSLSPLQVFGFGRSAYSGGSLLGCVLGTGALPFLDEQAMPVVVVVMVGVLLLCAASIRPVDIAIVLGEAATAPVEGGAQTPSRADASAQEQARVQAAAADPLADVHLSPRELEVFELMKDGRDAEYIANRLCISRNTAKTHIRNVYAKFGVHRRQDFIDVITGR